MDTLIDNVIILGGSGYLTRGWCVYEYIVSSLKGTVVCDEVQDPTFVSLRDWAATQPPVPRNPWRDSFESMQTNHINEMILRHVNQVACVYGKAKFRTEYDHSAVTGLLLEHLKRRLPAKKERQPYLGEWKYTPWTDEDLVQAFVGELAIPSQQTMPIRPFRTNVPDSIEQAVRLRYQIGRMSLAELTNPTASLARAFESLIDQRTGRDP